MEELPEQALSPFLYRLIGAISNAAAGSFGGAQALGRGLEPGGDLEGAELGFLGHGLIL